MAPARASFSTGLITGQQGIDPLLEGVAEIAVMSQRFEDLGKVLSACINPFIEHLPEAYQRLARATCWLADITWLEYPDYRGKLAAEKMLGMSVVGISHAERVWMAAALHIRYTGVFPRGSVFRGLLTKKERKSAFHRSCPAHGHDGFRRYSRDYRKFHDHQKRRNHLPFICQRQCRGWIRPVAPPY